MKKLLAVFLSALILATALPISALAVETIYGNLIGVEFHDNYIYEFNCDDEGKFDNFYVTFDYILENQKISNGCTYYRNSSVQVSIGEITFTDTQDDTAWTPGNTYQVTASVCGFTDVFNVEVRENPVESIEVDDCLYCTYDSESKKFVYYPQGTAYFKDSNSNNFSTGISISVSNEPGDWYPVEYIDTQDENPWVLGNTYEVTADFFGISTTFNVKAVMVSDIIVDNFTIIENCNGWSSGYWDEESNEYIENSWWQYDAEPEYVSIFYRTVRPLQTLLINSAMNMELIFSFLTTKIIITNGALVIIPHQLKLAALKKTIPLRLSKRPLKV